MPSAHRAARTLAGLVGALSGGAVGWSVARGFRAPAPAPDPPQGHWNSLPCSVARLADLDGDRVPELAVAHRDDHSLRTWNLRPIVLVVSGASGRTLATLHGPEQHVARRIEAVALPESPGAAVRVAWGEADLGERPDPIEVGDLDGDGEPERLETAGWSREGRSVVTPTGDGDALRLSGASTCAASVRGPGGAVRLAVTFDSEFLRLFDAGTGAPLGERDWRAGYRHGEGNGLEAIPDRDGDGWEDLLVTANEWGLDGDPGWLQILSGADLGRLRHLELRTLEAAPSVEEQHPAPGGVDACWLGDVDGDGQPELAVHAPALRALFAVGADDLRVRWRASLDWDGAPRRGD